MHTHMHIHTHPHRRSEYQLRLSAQRNLTLLHYKHHRLDILEVLHEGVQYKWKGAATRITSALFGPLPRANKVCQQFTLQLRGGTQNTGSCRDCCTPAHTNCNIDSKGQSTTEHYTASKEYKHAQKKSLPHPIKKMSPFVRQELKNPQPQHTTKYLRPPPFLQPSLNRVKSSKERSYTRVSELDRQP